jgi:hypothetical protein
MLKTAALFVCSACLVAAAQTPSAQSIDVPAGARVMLAAKGTGAQIYTCAGGKWTLKAPDAKLLDSAGNQIGTHFAGPTWKLTDGSEVKGKAIANQPSPDAGSVAWLLLEAIPGSGQGKLASVAYIRRTNTHGGVAPNEVCTGDTLSVPYSADYTFYALK